MTPDEASFVSDLRAKVLQNTQQGLPPHAGLSREDLKRAIEYCRKDYTANQSKSKAAGVSNPSGGGKAPSTPFDLESLFTNKKSG